MATLILASFDNESVRFEADYSDSNLRVSTVRCVNNALNNARATVLDGDTIIFQMTFLAGQTQQYNIAGQKISYDPNDNTIINFPYTLMFDYPSP